MNLGQNFGPQYGDPCRINRCAISVLRSPAAHSVSGLFIESLGEGAFSEDRTTQVQHLSASGWTFVPELLLINSNTSLKFIVDSLLCVLLMLVRVVVRKREGGIRG